MAYIDGKGLLQNHQAFIGSFQEVEVLRVKQRHVEIGSVQVERMFGKCESEGLIGDSHQVVSLNQFCLPEGEVVPHFLQALLILLPFPYCPLEAESEEAQHNSNYYNLRISMS